MIQESLRVPVSLQNETFGVVAAEVELVQNPGIFRAHQFQAFRRDLLELVHYSAVDLESSDALQFIHLSLQAQQA